MMPEDALDQFVEARTELFLSSLRAELEDIKFEVFESRSPREILMDIWSDDK